MSIIKNKKPKKVSIKWEKKSTSGNLFQALSGGLEFCLISDNNYQCSPFMFCKDYIQDAIHGTINSMNRSIYGFSYKSTQEHKPSIKKAKFLIANSSDSSMRNKIPSCLDFIHQIEERIAIKEKTEILEALEITDKTPTWLKKYFRCSVWLVEGSGRWIVSPVMISLYTLLIRIGFVHNIGETFEKTMKDIVNGVTKPYMNCDRDRLIKSKVGIDKILEHSDKKIFYKSIEKNYPPNLTMDDIHNRAGIVCFSQEIGGSLEHQKLLKHWLKKAK